LDQRAEEKGRKKGAKVNAIRKKNTKGSDMMAGGEFFPGNSMIRDWNTN